MFSKCYLFVCYIVVTQNDLLTMRRVFRKMDYTYAPLHVAAPVMSAWQLTMLLPDNFQTCTCCCLQ